MILVGKVGIVTGAGRGIGRELALAMAREGASLVVNDAGVTVDGGAAGERPADTVVSEIVALGGRAVSDDSSVTSHEAAREMTATAIREFGRLDFVVNNAGILRDAMFHKMTEAAWDDVIAVHLKGSFNVCRAAAGRFRAQGSGSILNMTSTSGLIGNYGQANYAAAKLGIVGLTRSIALELRRFGVRANAIAPFAWTRITSTIPDDGSPEAGARLEGLRAMTPAQIAPLAVYLVSDAAAHVSGQVFAVRGAEIVVFSLPRPSASIHQPGGWTIDTLRSRMATLESSFSPLVVTSDVFTGDPKL